MDILRTHQMFMDFAVRVAQESYCNRKRVGAILVRGTNILAIGFNGTGAGQDNNCEDENGLTKPEVIHAEDNVYRKLLTSTESAEGSTLYITLSPCVRCAQLIVDSGTKQVFYQKEYKCNKGIKLLEANHVQCTLLYC